MIFVEAVLAAFIGATWWSVLRRQDSYVGWRRRASLVGLILPTVALGVELLLTIVVAHHGSLEALNAASLRGGWSAFVAHAWVWLFFATGLLSFFGFAFAIAGEGNPRVAGAVCSCAVLASFFVNLMLAINSFH